MELFKTGILLLIISLIQSCGGGSGGSSPETGSTTSTNTFTKLYGSIGNNTYGYSVSANDYFYSLTGVGSGLDGSSTGDSFLTDASYSNFFSSWVKQMGVTPGSTYAYSSTKITGAYYNYGGIVVTGTTSGNLNSNTKTGTQDMFISYYDYDKSLYWTKLLGIASASTSGYGVVCYHPGYSPYDCYVVGTTNGNLSGQTKTGTYDLFISKFTVSTASGTLVWTRLLGVSGATTTGLRIAVSSDGTSVYATGRTTGNLDGQTLTGSTDLFVTKYTSAGVKTWTKLIGAAASTTSGYSIAVNSTAAYVVGYTNGAYSGNTQVSSSDGLIVALNLTNGNTLWSKQIGGSQSSSATNINDIVLDGGGNIYIVGDTTGSLTGNSLTGTKDGFVASYTSSGFNRWTKQIGVSTKDTIFNSLDYGNSELYIGGTTYGNLDGKTLTGLSDAILLKYGTDGTKY